MKTAVFGLLVSVAVGLLTISTAAGQDSGGPDKRAVTNEESVDLSTHPGVPRAALASLDSAAAGPAPEKQTPAFSVTIHATDARTKRPPKSIRVVPASYNTHVKQVTRQSPEKN